MNRDEMIQSLAASIDRLADDDFDAPRDGRSYVLYLALDTARVWPFERHGSSWPAGPHLPILDLQPDAIASTVRVVLMAALEDLADIVQDHHAPDAGEEAASDAYDRVNRLRSAIGCGLEGDVGYYWPASTWYADATDEIEGFAARGWTAQQIVDSLEVEAAGCAVREADALDWIQDYVDQAAERRARANRLTIAALESPTDARTCYGCGREIAADAPVRIVFCGACGDPGRLG